MIDLLKINSFNELKNIVINDFETIVFPEYPGIREIKERMYESGAEFSLMTGSGSTVFGIFPDKSLAMSAAFGFPAEYFTFISYGLN
jgi:4-diphosphocytidyl-2-C-methyl-D-erythritol kinase